MREAQWVPYALRHLVAVLDVLVHVLDARVEDVGQAVLAQVLHAQHAVGPGVRVAGVQPQRAQLLDGVQAGLCAGEGGQEGLRVDAEAGEHLEGALFVAEDVVEDGLAVVLGDVLGLADVHGHVPAVLIIWPVGVLLLALRPLPPPPRCTTLPFLIHQLLILGGIFVGISGARLAVIPAALGSERRVRASGPELYELVVDEQLLVELVGELQELVVVLIVEIEADWLVQGDYWLRVRAGGGLRLRGTAGGWAGRIGVELHYNAPT